MVADNIDPKNLRQVIDGGVVAAGAKLWHFEFNKIPEGYEFLVYVDLDLISVDHCAAIAMHLKTLLGVEGFDQNEIYIDVSSPGINRQLHNLEQCQDFMGHNVKCSFGSSGFIFGELHSVTEDGIGLRLDNGLDFNINFEKINQVNLQENINE